MYLTRRQRDVYNYIQNFIKKKGYSPTLEEICSGLNLSSLATIHKHLKNLEEKGVISRKWNHGRSIEISTSFDYPNTIEVPLLGEISESKPLLPVSISVSVSVPQEYVRGEETFALRVKDESMKDELFAMGDFLIVERKNTAKNGDLVLALLENGNVTVKKYLEEKGDIILESRNPRKKALVLKKAQIQLRGVLAGLMRKFE
jgi:repressor LexA